MHDLAAQAGPVLRNVRLIEELRASRQRLVVAQDGERRKLERNIHDGAQRQLVALGAALDAQARKSPVPVDVAVDGVGRLSQDVEAAVYFSCLEALQNVAKNADPLEPPYRSQRARDYSCSR